MKKVFISHASNDAPVSYPQNVDMSKVEFSGTPILKFHTMWRD
jgi:hypothetical protein